MDDATQSLVRTLRASATDLAKLIEVWACRRPPVVYVAEPAVTAWETRAPAAWQAARQWLEGHRITIRTLCLTPGHRQALRLTQNPATPPTR